MKILVIDNYDSFVYNLVCMIKNLVDAEVHVVKNDKLQFETMDTYNKILLSPGPGIPKNAGKLMQVLEQKAASVSILGVCLGHQAIAEYSGGSLYNLPQPLHGIASNIAIIKEDYLFQNTPKHFKIGHYHSWTVLENETSDFEVLARDENQNIMAIKHKKHDVRGLQFHPESVLTEYGTTIINNWLTH